MSNLTLEKLKIDERLRQMENTLNTLLAMQSERWDMHYKQTDQRYQETVGYRKELDKTIGKMLTNCAVHGGKIEQLENRKINGYVTKSISFFWGVLALLWGAIIWIITHHD